MKNLIRLTIGLYCLLATACFAADQPKETPATGLSAQALGILHNGAVGKPTYGAGADIGYDFNKYVSGHARLVAYEADDWGGSAIDEASLLVKANLFRSANKRVGLFGLGGVDRSFGSGPQDEAWGLSVGGGIEFAIYGNLSAGVDSRARAWFQNNKWDITSAGFLQYKF